MKLLSVRLAMFLSFLILAGGIFVSGVWGASQEVTKEELIDLYNRVREAVMKVDLATFEKLVLPPKPDVKKLTQKDLIEAKELIEGIFPDLSKAKFHKFAQNAEEALFVVQTDLEDKESVHLSVFRFLKKDGQWMLWAKFAGTAFPKENPQAVEERIKKILDNNQSYQLQAQTEKADQQSGSVKARAPKAGETGSGFLTVAQKTYNFGHAFAFRKKAYGYDDKVNILVVLTEEAVSVESVQAQLREKDDWSEFVSHLILIYEPDLKPDYVNFWVKQDSTSFSGPLSDTKGQAELKGERIKGSLKMEKPRKLFDDTYIFDVSFEAPIISK